MLTRLSDIKPSELSLVRRGAVRRPFLFTKAADEFARVGADVDWAVATTPDGDELEIRASVLKTLATPADGEAEFLAKTLGEEAGAERARLSAAVYRLAKSLGVDVSSAPVPQDQPVDAARERNPVERGERMADDGAAVSRKVEARAVEIRKADTSLTAEQARARAYRELTPGEYAALQAHNRAVAVRKAEEDAPPPAARAMPVAIRKAADGVRARAGNEGMTIEKAAAVAVTERPELADHWRAVDAARSAQ